jgi:energy-coupling factor transporter ATP-binding protein EcfA2
MSDNPETTESVNPFPGLRPFEQEETHLFFGRDGQSKELLKRLQDSRFLALVGVSGSGKSSLVRAGLLPALYGGLMSAVESDWRIAVFRPGNNPIRNMAHALITQAGMGGDSGLEDVEVAIAETTLRRGNLGLLELLKQAKRKVRVGGRPFLGANENVLIVVDQFEEIFRIIEQYDELVRVKHLSEGHSDLEGNVADGLDYHPRDEASAFVKLLLESTRKNKDGQYGENIYIIVTMRSDYLGETAQFWGMPEKINEGQYLIPRMNRDERRKAIVGPVAVAGGSIAEPLVNQLLNDAGENPGHLPILQHALMRMWELAGSASRKNGGLNLGHYDQIGKLSGALSQHANEAYDELSPEHQKLAANIFKGLTEKGLSNREIRRPMTIAEICAVVGAKESDVKTVVECFRKEGRWFLMPPPTKDKEGKRPELKSETLIDISHESLISGWDKLSKWVNEEAESARTYKRLADTAILKDRGEEEFYRGTALQVALKWREVNAPNAAWARRYHPEFDKAIAFLDGSLKDTQQREQAEKDRVAKDLRRTRNYNIGLIILAIVSAGIAIYAYSTKRVAIAAQEEVVKAQQSMLETQQKQVVTETKLKDKALAEQDRATKAEQAALDAATKLQASLDTEKELLKQANVAKALAIKERDNARRLQDENYEQAQTNHFFKSAFDSVAAREYKDAITTLEDGLRYFEDQEKKAPTAEKRRESLDNRVSAVINMADIHRSTSDSENNDDELAVKEYDLALELMNLGSNRLLGSTLLKAGSVWKDSKDAGEARKAAGYYEKGALEYESLGNMRYASLAWFEAGKIHLRFMDETGFKPASEAFDLAVSSLRSSALANRSAEIGEAYKLAIGGPKPVVEVSDRSNYVRNLYTQQRVDDDYGTDSRTRNPNQLRKEGAAYFLKAANAFETFGDLKNAADNQENRGELLSGSTAADQLKTAAEAYKSASNLYGRDGNRAKQASVLLEGGANFLENNSEDAKKLAAMLFDQAAEVYNDNPARKIETLVRVGKLAMGSSASRGSNIAKGEKYFDAALRLAKEQPDKKMLASAHMAVGEVFELARESAPAVQQYESALAIYIAERDLYGQAMALYNLSSISGSGKSEFRDRALAAFASVLPTLEASGKSVDLAEAYFAIGLLHRQNKNYQEALKNFNLALAIFKPLPDQASRARNVENLIKTTQRLAEKP